MYVQALSIEYTLEKPRPELGDVHVSPLFHRVSAICPVLHIFGKAHVPPVPCLSGQSPPHHNHSSSSSTHADKGNAAPLSHGGEQGAEAGCTSSSSISNSSNVPVLGATPAAGQHVTLTNTDLSPLPVKPSTASAGQEAGHTPHRAIQPPQRTIHGEASPEEQSETEAWSTYSVCLHVHGCYPYFMVPQYDPTVSATQFGAQLEAVALQVLHQQQRAAQNSTNNNNNNNSATSIRSVTVTVGDNDNEGPAATQPEPRWDNNARTTSSAAAAAFDNNYGYGNQYYGWRDRRTPQLLHDVELIERVPFYGYHAQPCAFFKVHVIDPSRMQWLMSLLHDTSYIGGRHWRLFEGHNKFHSQFMVDYDVSGVAPVMLRRGCHVRQPTVPEFSPAGEVHEYDDEVCYNNNEDEDYMPTEEDRRKMQELRAAREAQRQEYARMLAAHYGIEQVHIADDPPRESTCELELDIAAHILIDTNITSSSKDTRPVREPGANLAHLRRLIQRYFAEHGVDDALRVAKTMAVEEEELEAWRRGLAPMTTSLTQEEEDVKKNKKKTDEEAERARDKRTAAPGKTEEAALRYGSVIQIQRNDAMLTAMREKMHELVLARPVSEVVQTEDACCFAKHESMNEAGQNATQAMRMHESGNTQELFDALIAPCGSQQQIMLAPLSFSTTSSPEEANAVHNTNKDNDALSSALHANAKQEEEEDNRHTGTALLGAELPDVLQADTTTQLATLPEEHNAGVHVVAKHDHSDDDAEDEVLLLSDQTYTHSHELPASQARIDLAHTVAAAAAAGDEDEDDPLPLLPSTTATPSSSPHRGQGSGSPSVTPMPTTQRTTHSTTSEREHGDRVHNASQPPQQLQPLHITPVDDDYDDEDEVVLLSSTPHSASASPSQQQHSHGAVQLASVHTALPVTHDDNDGVEEEDEALLFVSSKSASEEDKDEARQTPAVCPSVQILSAASPTHSTAGGDAVVVVGTGASSPAKELHDIGEEEDEDGDDGKEKAEAEEVLDCDAMTPSVVVMPSPASQGVTSGPCLSAAQAALLRALQQGRAVRVTSALLADTMPATVTMSFALRYDGTSRTNGTVCMDVMPPWAMRGVACDALAYNTQALHPQQAVQAANTAEMQGNTTTSNTNVALRTRRSVPLMTCVRRGSAGSGSAEVAALPVIDRHARTKRAAAATAAQQQQQQSTRAKKAEETTEKDEGRAMLADSHATNNNNNKGEGVGGEELMESSPRFSAGREHALQCILRVVCVEVLVQRRHGVQLLSADPIRAVALGQTTSSSDDVSITIYGVRSSCRGQASPLREYELSAHVQVIELASEAEVLQQACEAILHADPDILLSWEGYKYGMGLLSLRYGIVLHRSLARDLSRLHRGNPYTPPQANKAHNATAYNRRAAFMHAFGRGAQHAGGSAFVRSSYAALRPTSFTRLSAQDQYERARRAAHYTIRAPMQMSRRLRRLQRKREEASKNKTGALGKAKAQGNARRRFFTVAAAAAAAAAGGSNNEGPASFVAEGIGFAGDAEEEKEEGKADATTAGNTHNNNAARENNREQEEEEEDDAATRTARQYAKRFGANVRIAGRVCVSLCKSIRKEVKLPSYSLTMAYQSLLKATLPYFSDTVLAAMYDGRQMSAGEHEDKEEQPHANSNGEALHVMALHYLVSRIVAPHRIARHLHHYARTMEYSRMFGILFEEVMTRGSQFRVEATLRRMTGPQGYAMLSPSRAMVYRQPRIQCIPLIMQPLCDFYRDPVVVLDFRSLYPSMIIAYNLCYSTCVGMVQPDTCSRLGVLPDYVQDNALLAELVPDDGDGFDHLTFTPNGAMFVKPTTRIGVLPAMIRTVLDTRFELQAALQHVALPSRAKETQQRLAEQQQALKMLANVTYGYTGASYTGRMPCVDLAEAIVSLARQTLERAIALVEETPQWRARVIYGDTDSMFVWLPQRSRAEAFAIGAEMARAVTAANPAPVRLQFEKVLQPCFLVVRKRYVGYAWYSPGQKEPQYLAKGIETERRDQCAATTKLTRAMIERYFRRHTTTTTTTTTNDHNNNNKKNEGEAALRAFYVEQVSKLQRGDCNPADCIFRRAVKLGRYKDEAHLPLGAHLALQLMERDLAHTPFWGERIPYVVVRRLGRQELRQRVVQPEQMLFVNRHLVLDADYYIHCHLNAALDRIFYLVNVSCARWYSELPRRRSSTTGGAQRYAELQAFLRLKTRQSIAHTLWWERVESADAAPNNNNCNDDGSAGVCYAARTQRKRRRSAIEAELRRGYAEDTAIVVDEDTERPSTSVHEDTHRKNSPEVVVVVVEDEDEDNDEEGEESKATPQEKEEEEEDTAEVNVHKLEQSKLVTVATPLLPSHGEARLNTLDAYYPRVLCVCCEQNIVTLAEQQRDFLAFMVEAKDLRNGNASKAAQLCGQGQASPNGLMRATSLPALQALAAVPPICAECWGSPLQLYSRIARRYARVSRRLRAAQQACACCMGSCGTVNGPAFFARLVCHDGAGGEEQSVMCETNDHEEKKTEEEEKVQGVVVDMEDLARAAPHVAVPRELTGAIAEYEPSTTTTSNSNSASNEDAMYSVLGCSSIDCPLGFEKKRLTQLADQLRALQWYLQEVL